MNRRDDEWVSASELARMGYCERQVAFDATCGRSTTRAQRQARKRGLLAHAEYLQESRRVVQASARKGRCFVATLVLGDCEATRNLRAFRDLCLRRSMVGRWLIGAYYRVSPRICAWLDGRPVPIRLMRPVLGLAGRAAGMAVASKLG